MKYKNKSLILVSIIFNIISFQTAFAAGNQAEATATATIRIKTKLQLVNTAPLRFEDTYQGDGSVVISATDPNAAEFKITGQQGSLFMLMFPMASAFMTTGGGNSPEKKIPIDQFTTNFANNSGVLDPLTGTQVFRVGATRGKILNTQVIANDYTGSFLVRVTY